MKLVKKKRPGRPPLSNPEDRREGQIKIAVNEAEKDELQRAAEAESRKLSDWARVKLLESARKKAEK